MDNVISSVTVLDYGLVRLVGHTRPASVPFDLDHVFTFEVKAPLSVLAQWLPTSALDLSSHRYIPEMTNISEGVVSDAFTGEPALASVIQSVINMQTRQALEVYEVLLKKGCPVDLAKLVLPLSTYGYSTYTSTLHSLIEFFELATSLPALSEKRLYAAAILSIVKSLAPELVVAELVS